MSVYRSDSSGFRIVPRDMILISTVQTTVRG